MHIVLVEPAFPINQREFVRALRDVGAKVTGIGERPLEALDAELRNWLYRYVQVRSVVDERALLQAVRETQAREPVHRLEATIEAHIMATANVRKACGIAGTSVETAFLCRDKPAMKDALRKAGIPCARSTGAATADAVRAFAAEVGYPLILKPRDAAGASGTHKVDDQDALEQVLHATPFARGAEVAVEEFIEGHEGFYDTITVGGEVLHDFACHYYPNVLEAMRTRWISPQFITTNRIDTAPAYGQVKDMGARAIRALGIDTSATHMEWFFGSRGLKFSEIGCRPPGVRAWDLYAAANDMDIYREWAMAIVHGRRSQTPSRRYSAGIIALRPDRDGRVSGYDGAERLFQEYGEWVIDSFLPPPGTPTQPVEAGYMANAWIRMRHPDYDELRRLLDHVGQTVKLRAG